MSAVAIPAETTAVDLARVLQGATARTPAISWRAEMQPVPQHRVRVTFGRDRTYVGRGHGDAYVEDPDLVYRDELRMRWHAARLGKWPLEGDLVAVFLFAGNSSGRRYRPDFTNAAKAVEDAGNPSRDGGWRGLWLDDGQIVVEAGWIVSWGKSVRPFVALDVWRLE